MRELFHIILGIALTCGAQISSASPVEGGDGSLVAEDYVCLTRKNERGWSQCAIMRLSNRKMITGWDFEWVQPASQNGLIHVKSYRRDNMGRNEFNLKMNGDGFFIVGEPSEGMRPITDAETGKMGVMSDDGRIVVAPSYDEVGTFRCGMCRVWIVEKGNGFINNSGVLVVPCQYPSVLDFGTIEGVVNYTQVWDCYGYSYYIDKQGKVADPDKVMREAYDNQIKGGIWPSVNRN